MTRTSSRTLRAERRGAAGAFWKGVCQVAFFAAALGGSPAAHAGKSNDGQPPTVSITGPATGTTYTSAQAVTITAIAADNTAISKVEFYLGTSRKFRDKTAPYAYVWNVTSALNGTHSWTARAYDKGGIKTTSIPVVVTVAIGVAPPADTTKPSIGITVPTTAATWTTSSPSVVLGGTASDNVGVTSVTWANAATSGGGQAAGTTPWSGTVPLAQGSNVILMTAKDAANLSGTATITVNYVPSAPPTPGAVSTSNTQFGSFVSSPFTLTTGFSSSDSAVTSCHYSTDGGGTWLSGTVTGAIPSFTCTKTGVTGSNGQALSLTMRATNSTGTSTATPVARSVDAVGPTTASSADANSADANWSGNDQIVTFTASDSGSGVAHTKYCTDTANTCTPGIAGASAAVSCAAGTVCETYVRFQSTDNVNNAEAIKSALVRIDKAAPVTTSNAPAGWVAADQTITLTPTDGNGAGIGNTRYCTDTTNTCTPVTTGTSAPVTCAAGAACQTYLRFFSHDAVFNVETTKSALVRIDKVAPTDGSIGTTPGSGQITLSWSGFADSGSGLNAASYKLAFSTAGSPAATCSSGTVLATGSATSYTHTGLVNGNTYSYRVCVADNIGNVSSGATASYTPQAGDTTPPVGSLAINAGAAFSSTSAVTLTLSATDAVGVTGYYVSTSASPPAAGAAGWTTVGPASSYNGGVGSTLAAGDGSKTLYAWYKDAASNVSTAASASIVLDQTAPTNGNVGATPSSGQVALSWSGFADSGSGLNAASYKLVFSTAGSPAATCSSGTVLATGSATSYTHTGLVGGTTYSYRVCVADNAGNVASGATTSATPADGGPDTTAPTGSVLIDGGAAYSNSATTVTLTLSATDAVGVTGYFVAFSSTKPLATAAAWVAVTSTPNFSANVAWTPLFPTSEGSRTVYAWYKDAAGNVSATASDAIILDHVAPSNGTLAATAGLYSVALTWTVASDLNGLATIPYRLVYSTASTPANCSSGTLVYTGSDMSFNHTGLTASAPHHYRVCAVDNAGNMSLGATASATPVANQPPVAEAGPPQTGVVGTPIYFDGSGSYDVENSIVSYRYDFGDGTSHTSTSAGVVSHVYASVTNTTMTLTVTDGYGATSSDSTQVAVTTAPVAQGNFPSVKRLGGAGGDWGDAVAVDRFGNTVVVGTFQGTVNFGGAALTSRGVADIFIAKYSSAGVHVCSRQVGSAGAQAQANAVAVDASGNIFIAGSFDGGLDFGGVTLGSMSSDAFVAKYSSSCGPAVQWVRSFGSGNDDAAFGLAVDPDGDVIVTGYFRGSADFGAGITVSNGPFADVFVAKYAGSTGDYMWARTLYGASTDAAQAVAVDRDGNVVVAGYFRLTVASGETYAPLMASVGSMDGFLLKYAPDGTFLWSRSFGGPYDDVVYGVGVDDGGNIAVVGTFQQTVDFGGGDLVSAGTSDIFVAKFSPMGNHIWSRQVGDTGNDDASGLAVDPVGNVVLTGALDVGSGATDRDILVAKYSAAGTPLWSRSYVGTSGNDFGAGVALDGSGNVFVTGTFYGSINFGSGAVTSAGSNDVFLLSLGP